MAWLQRAAQSIIATRTDRRFPLPAEIAKICAKILQEDKAREPRLAVMSDPDDAADYDARCALADQLVAGEMGRRAANDGWILPLHEFAQLHRRLPRQPHEIERCIRNAAETNDVYEKCLRGDHPYSQSLVELGKNVMARRDRLAAMVLGRG